MNWIHGWSSIVEDENAKVPGEENPPVAASRAAAKQKEPKPHDDDGWNTVSSHDWPVSAAALSSFLVSHSSGQNGGSVAGVANKMTEIRWNSKSSMIARDAGLIPAKKKFRHRFSCSEAHPGLCCTKHHQWYSSCLSLAKNIEKFFTLDLCHGFFQIYEQSDTVPFALYRGICFWFGHVCRRRLHAQVTHVFIPCVHHPDDTFSLEQRRGGRAYTYLSSWGLALRYLMSACTSAMVVQHSHDHGGGGVYALRRNAESVRLWPALERAARERANPDVGAQLNLCEWRPAPKRRRGESGVVIDMPAVVGREADMPPASDFVADGGAREIEIDEDDDEYLLSSGDEDHFLPPDRDESAVVDGSVDVGAVGEARGPASCNPRTPPASHGDDPTDAVGDVPLAPRSTDTSPLFSGDDGDDTCEVENRVGRRCARQRRGLPWERCELEQGIIFVYNSEGQSLSVHCPYHDGCRLNRTTKAGKNQHQGRCIGFLMAWCERGADIAVPDQSSHMLLSKKARADGAPGREVLTHEWRSQARARVRGQPNTDSLFAKERAQREGEPVEPIGFC